MFRRSTIAALLALTLAGCGAAEDAARGAAGAARDEATRAAGGVVAEAVRGRICAVVGDGQVSEAEVAVLRAAIAGAEGAGLPEEITSAVREVVGAEGRPTGEAVRRLEEACAR